MADIIMVYITVPSEEKAKEISRILLEKRLIACATTWPCSSMYWWEGSIQDGKEFIIFAKTTDDVFALLEREVAHVHPYQVPCIIKIDAIANAPYTRWIRDEIQSK